MATRRPALDVTIPNDSSGLDALVAALVDDFRPFAVEERSPAADAAGEVQRIYFFTPDDRAAAARVIADSLGPQRVTAIPIDVPDDGEAWARRSQEGLSAVRVGRVVITPPWNIPPPDPDIVTVVVRPSMGFGTGHHPSTRLCLRALQRLPLRNLSVTDLGTGSGVLAVTAARLGATSVEAIDCDHDALTTARETVVTNDVASVVTLRWGDLHALGPTRPAAVVLANLTGGLLRATATTVAQCAAPGGTLILSGLTGDEGASVRQAFVRVARVEDQFDEADWIALMMKTL